MNNKTYLVTLTPLDWYFFGGENTFGEGDGARYYAKSNKYPQETTLLGMVRFKLLKQYNLLPLNENNRAEANKLIGQASFNYHHKNNAGANFGTIQFVSPVFIGKDQKLFCKAPFHYGQKVEFKERSKTVFYSRESVFSEIPVIEGFRSKDYFNQAGYDQWLDLETGMLVEKMNEENIFSKRTRIGITKKEENRGDENGGKNKNGFFKMDTFRLKPGFSFAFYLSLSEGISFPEQSEVFLGAERSLFKMEVVDVSERDYDYKQKLNSSPIAKQEEIYFVSDAFIPEKIFELCRFAWLDTVPFKNITTTTKHTNYAALNKDTEKSKRFNLVRRGSVIFCTEKNKKNILKLIDNPYLQSFGYNQYVTIQ